MSDSFERKRPRTIRNLIRLAFQILITCLLLFIVIEGPTGTVTFLYDIYKTRPLAGSVYTQYDELLGWKNIPNIFIKNAYGPGVYLKTNSQSFRNNRDFSKDVPEGKLRIICSGDSFTLGYGVDNDNTWCEFLTKCDRRIEAVNMGQGGYGIDQMYLWYRQDGCKLRHHIHILAFIDTDISRMKSTSFLGYGKPALRIKGGTILVENIPVPTRPYYIPWLIKYNNAIANLKSVKLIKRILRKLDLRYKSKTEMISEKQIRLTLLKIFDELNKINKEENIIFIVVRLPQRELRESDKLGGFLSRALRARNIHFIDLSIDFRELPDHEVNEMFITADDIPYMYAGGHYSKEGNKYVAEIIYKNLIAIPEVADIFRKICEPLNLSHEEL